MYIFQCSTVSQLIVTGFYPAVNKCEKPFLTFPWGFTQVVFLIYDNLTALNKEEAKIVESVHRHRQSSFIPCLFCDVLHVHIIDIRNGMDVWETVFLFLGFPQSDDRNVFSINGQVVVSIIDNYYKVNS